MALIKCGECGTQISRDAVACPKCGKPQAKKTSGCLVLFSVLVVLGLIGKAVDRDEKPKSAPAAVAVQDAAAKKAEDQRRAAVEAQERAAATKGLDVMRAALGPPYIAAGLHPQAYTVLRVVVADQWLAGPAALRKKQTTDVWQAWVRAVGGQKNADHWRVSIVDTNGDEHAGSRMLGGSLIWADD